ncbi:MAG: hypothetical protein ACRD6I_02220 [Candidatus Acidiferrales bacterium]
MKAKSAKRRRLTRPAVRRRKISTTIGRENFAFLKALAERRGANLADAVDEVVERVRQAENRKLLEEQTTAYFASLPPDAEKEENEIGSAMSEAAGEIDFDRG